MEAGQGSLTRRLAAILAALLLVALPVAAQAPAPPKGSVVVGVWGSDGSQLVLLDSVVVPPVCLPEAIS